MSDYSCLYTTATGEIVAIAETADLPAAGAGQSIYAGDADINEHYILAGVRTDRPLLPFYTTTAPDVLGAGEATNLCLRSQEFDNAAWVSGSTTESANSVVAPDGTTTADTITYTATSGQVYQVVTVLPSTAYVFSYWVKLGTKTNSRHAIYDHTNLAFITPATDAAGVSSGAWTRVAVPFTTPGTCTQVRLYVDRADLVITGTIHLWGAQLELGSVATGYIATTSAAITRLYFDDAEEYPIASDGVDAVTVGLPSGTIVTDMSDSIDYTSSGVENLVVTSAIVAKFDFFLNPPFPYKTIALRVNANDHS